MDEDRLWGSALGSERRECSGGGKKFVEVVEVESKVNNNLSDFQLFLQVYCFAGTDTSRFVFTCQSEMWTKTRKGETFGR